jgi:two-component system, NtrC family, sensor kinase
MLGFSRSNQQHNPTDLNALVENCLELMESHFEIARKDGSARIQLERQLAANLPAVSCSASEIQQVLLNIIRNAVQALAGSESAAPLIEVSTGFDGRHAWIRIADNGPGITPEVRRHIFEPFFTTKEVGQGTGLGMSISYFIITEHHRGTIDIDSSPGKGAAFIIRLPLDAA